MELYINRLTLRNFKCFSDLTLDTKQVCVIQGGNGVGKSTILEAVKATLDGGYCQEWIQTGKDEAEVILSLSNGVTVTLSLKAPNSKRSKPIRTVEITAADGSQIKAPQTYLKQLATGIAYDPARFLTSNDKERAQYIAQFLNVSLEARELVEAAGGDWILAHYNPQAGPFDRIKAVRDAVYTKRATVNKEANDKRGFVQTLRTDIPTLNDDPAAVEAEAIAADAEGIALMKESTAAYREIDAAAQAERESIWFEKRAADQEARRIYEAALAAHELAAQKADQKVEQDAEKARQEARAKYDPLLGQSDRRVKAAQYRRDALMRAQGVLSKINEMDAAITALAGESIRLDAAIERIDDLKKAKLAQSNLPDGVEIVDGCVYVDGRPFDTGVNTARKIEVAIQLAAMNPGELRLLLLDDAEHLAPGVWEELVEAVKAAGFQMMAARVDGDGALKLAEVAA